jgi:hypothetical protein
MAVRWERAIACSAHAVRRMQCIHDICRRQKRVLRAQRIHIDGLEISKQRAHTHNNPERRLLAQPHHNVAAIISGSGPGS